MGAKKKSETPVPKTEKASKTPQPAPKPAIKKDKDPSESFLLWMQEPLENLEVQINSKKRLLETLDTKTEDFDSEVKQNLLIRDQQINFLNKTILGLRTELKVKEDQIRHNDHSAKIAALKKELNALNAEKETFEENMKNLREEFEAAQANWDDEKDSMLLQQEAVVEEQQALTARLGAKESELKSVKEDIQQMGKIVAEMNKINHDLHEKIQKNNENVEKAMKKYMKAKARASIVKELEERLATEIEEKNEAFKKVSFWSQFFEVKLKSGFEELKAAIEWLIKANKSSKTSSDTHELEILKVFDKTHEVLEILKTAYLCSNEQLSRQGSDTAVILLQVKQAQNQIFDQILNKNCKNLNDSLAKLKKESFENIAGLTKIIDQQKDSYKILLEKNHSQLSDLEKKEAEVQKLKKKVQNQISRIEKSKEKQKEILNKESEYKNSIKSLQKKIEEMAEERKSTSNLLNVREKRIKGTLLQIQVLREEIFNKDSEVIKKGKDILRLEKFLEELKAQVQQVNSKMKLSDFESLKKVNQEIEDKDKQIAMLKEMLRASNAEIKAKESAISHMKRKSENLNRSKDFN